MPGPCHELDAIKYLCKVFQIVMFKFWEHKVELILTLRNTKKLVGQFHSFWSYRPRYSYKILITYLKNLWWYFPNFVFSEYKFVFVCQWMKPQLLIQFFSCNFWHLVECSNNSFVVFETCVYTKFFISSKNKKLEDCGQEIWVAILQDLVDEFIVDTYCSNNSRRHFRNLLLCFESTCLFLSSGDHLLKVMAIRQ